MLKTNKHLHHTGSMVRNAQLFGAKAVILFPDPSSYILTRKGTLGNLPDNISLSHSAKFVPGDPLSPYVASYKTSPSIPVVSLSYNNAKVLLTNFTNSFNVDKSYWFGLPLKTLVERNFTASVEVNRNFETKSLHNVVASIPGRYEPTRYIIIGSHHDSWHQGASKPGIGHSVLMELVRTFGYLSRIGWQPGRSILFASWDGEEYGELGSTSWLYRHSKEIGSRGVAYINMDYLLQGADEIHVPSSPLLRDILMVAAKTVACKDEHAEEYEDPFFQSNNTKTCKLFDDLLKKFYGKTSLTSSSFSVFQNMLGISSSDLAIKNRHEQSGDSYPYLATTLDSMSKAERFLELKHAESMAKFLVVVTLQLVSAAKLPLSSTAYGSQIEKDLDGFLSKNADQMAKHSVRFQDIQNAAKKFSEIAMMFHYDYNPSPALDMLAHHEFNDQLLELERSFLLPSFVMAKDKEDLKIGQILDLPHRQVIYGPSPLNLEEIVFLPRLSAALEVAKLEDTAENWNVVERETFFVVDALESARCVLDNHLVTDDNNLTK